MNINQLKSKLYNKKHFKKTAGIAGNISSYYTNLDPAKTNFFRPEEDLKQAARFTDALANSASLATLLGMGTRTYLKNKEALNSSGGLFNLIMNPKARENAIPLINNLKKGLGKSVLGAAIAYPLAGIIGHNLYRNAQKNRESIEKTIIG